MKFKLAFFLGLLTSGLGLAAFAQGTAFTYQGRLNDGVNPATGIYDLQFTIYDSTNNPGTIVAGPLTNAAIGVSNGLFAVTLDFGAGVFTGADRWLEIAVRPAAGGAFFTLLPRQPLTPAPYALYAPNAGAAATAATATLAGSVANGAVTAAALAPGAAAANLNAGGQSGVASGGMILSGNPNDSSLANAGYVKLGKAGSTSQLNGAPNTPPSGRAAR
jgi:hypothetical protein